MRLIIQRVLEAGVKVNGEFISKIGPGIIILLGLHKGDSNELVDKWSEKALKIKLWPELEEQTEEQKESDNPKGKGGWKTSVLDNNFDVLVVSNFTLYGILKGNKPDFHESMNADEAKALYNRFLENMQNHHKKEKVQGGQFQTYMNVQIVNDGPVTLCIDADEDNEEKNNQNKQKQQKQEKKSVDNSKIGQDKEHQQQKPHIPKEKKQKPQGDNQQQKQNAKGENQQHKQKEQKKQKQQKEEKKQVIYEEKQENPTEKYQEKLDEQKQE